MQLQDLIKKNKKVMSADISKLKDILAKSKAVNETN